MGFWSWLLGDSGPNHPPEKSSNQCRVLGVRARDGRRLVRVKRNSQQLYQEKGWRLKQGILYGYYRTRYKSFEGRIEDPFSEPSFVIIKPPKALLRGEHGECFRQIAKDMYIVHWLDKPIDVNIGILVLENCITEAIHD